MRLLGLVAILAVLLGSLLGLLARAPLKETQPLQARTAVAAYDRLEPGVTLAGELPRLGFDTGEAVPLSYLGMMEQFVRGDSFDFDALDAPVKACFEGRARCAAYAFPLSDMPGTRAVVVIADGRVVYKGLDGEIRTSTANPSSSRY